MLFSLFVLLHIITAAAWFGLGLGLTGQARAVAEPGASALGAAGTRTVQMMGLFSVLTLVFGLLALVLGRGFAGYGPQFHTSLLLIAALVGVQYLLIGPAWKKLAAGDAGARGRIAMGTGIGHVLWLVTLVLMLWERYLGPAL